MEPTQKEIEHGIALLRVVKNWQGGMAVIEIDSVCKWNEGEGECGDPIANACVLLHRDRTPPEVDIAVYCTHHTRCMERALEVWREQN